MSFSGSWTSVHPELPRQVVKKAFVESVDVEGLGGTYYLMMEGLGSLCVYPIRNEHYL